MIIILLSACGQPFGMETKLIADHQITASSSFLTYKYESSPEYRWPHRGRLNYKFGSWGWHPATQKTPGDWFQVDLGEISDIRCIGLQGRASKIQFIEEYKIAYSMDGGKWDYAETNYERTVRISL